MMDATDTPTAPDKAEEVAQDSSESTPTNEEQNDNENDKEKVEVEENQDVTGKRKEMSTVDGDEAGAGTGSGGADEKEKAADADAATEGEETTLNEEVKKPTTPKRKRRKKTDKTPTKNATAPRAQQQQPNMNMQLNMRIQRAANMQMNMMQINMQRQAMQQAAQQQQQQMMAMNNNPMAMTMMMSNNMMMNNPMAAMNPMAMPMTMMNPMATGHPFSTPMSMVQKKQPSIKVADKPTSKPTSKPKRPSRSHHPTKGTRGSYNKPELSEAEHRLKDSLLEGAAKMMLKKQAVNGGRIPSGYMNDLLADLRKSAPVLRDVTRDAIYNTIRKLPYYVKADIERTFAPPPSVALANAKEKKGPPTEASKDVASIVNTFKRNSPEDYEAALEWATIQFMEKQKEVKSKGEKLANGWVKSLVEEAKTTFGLSMNINPDTIRSRAKRNNPKGRIGSPMEEVEPVLVQLCIEANQMGEPLDKTNFLALANSLIKGTPTAEKVKKFKETCKHDGDAELGIKYYHQFMKRNKAAIRAGSGHKENEQEGTPATLGSPNSKTATNGTNQGVAAVPPSVAAATCPITAVLLAADPQTGDNYVRKFRSMLIENDITDFTTLSLATKEDLRNAGVSLGGALNIYNTVQKMMADCGASSTSSVGLEEE